MKTEKIGNVTAIIADDGKCFKNDNLQVITQYITLSKYDSVDNYVEVDIADYELELQKKLMTSNSTDLSAESAIIDNDITPDTAVNPDEPNLEDIIARVVTQVMQNK